MEKVEHWLQWHFALLTVLCGYLLGSDDQAGSLTVIALIAAVTSVIFVDRLKWVHLPSPLAYLLMILASGYSMWIFFTLGPGHQLSAVAILLIMVQGILLYQHKSRRVYEQMCVFCLLQLIVGAVLNDALNFGLLLIPITLLLLSALVLLQIWRPLERMRQGHWLKVQHRVQVIQWNDVSQALTRSLIPGWLGMFLLAGIFFYALPRASGTQPRSSGRTSIGFSDEVSLDQLGQLSMNPQIAMRLRFTDHVTGQNYALQDGAYLRGVVVDQYSVDNHGIGKWRKGDSGSYSIGGRRSEMPLALVNSPGAGYDLVDVHVDMESMDTPQLFSIAPYHKNAESQELYHVPGRWLLERAVTMDGSPIGKPAYGFGSQAFFHGIQTPWLRHFSRDDDTNLDSIKLKDEDYKRLLQFESKMPTLKSTASEIVEALPESGRQKHVICQALTQYLSDSGKFSYTRTLSQPPPTGVDPTEDFFSRTRAGHCQYFASSLAMMLRSQNIPARIVIGFRVHEYNQLGRFWIVRQQDAHAWVEAYLKANEIPATARTAGQAKGGGVWLRLDPTPPMSFNGAGQVGQAMDLAQSLWKEFVVEMDDKRQSDNFFSFYQTSEFQSLSIWERWQMAVVRLRAGDLSAAGLTYEQLVSWQAAVITMFLGIMGYCLWSLWNYFRSTSRVTTPTNERPTNQRAPAYYLSLLQLLSAGGQRQPSQTPKAWSVSASHHLRNRSIPIPENAVARIIARYYQFVYGGKGDLREDEKAEIEQSLDDIRKAWVK